ncbi:amidase signature domain-containing protein [Xylariales sp. PMI_506]|nr:amidase signature domain-containing protein [Xylariales sp. PMI_506]
MASLTAKELLTLDSSVLQERLAAGLLTSVDLVKQCLQQIENHDHRGLKLNAMISTVPRQILMARSKQLDQERAEGRVRSVLHGIPMLVKDAIATRASLGVPTTLGSYAFENSFPRNTSKAVDKLEEMGVIVLGKTNLNELVSAKSDCPNANGWSAIGGQTTGAYLAREKNQIKFGQHDPCGSSTGSAVGVSAGYAPIALGTEAYGSIVMPATRAALYALKPALESTEMDGISRIAKNKDVEGAMARSSHDVAVITEALLKPQYLKQITQGSLTEFLTKSFKGLRIGFLDPRVWKYPSDTANTPEDIVKEMHEKLEAAISKIGKEEGTHIEYPVSLPPLSELNVDGKPSLGIILAYEAKEAFEDWFRDAEVDNIKTLEDLIKFNEDNAFKEFDAEHPDQGQLLRASRSPPSRELYEQAVFHSRNVAKDQGVDKLFAEKNLNLLAYSMDALVHNIAAAAGYPIATVPLGITSDGRPIGIGVMAQSGNEGLLLQFMSAMEAHFPPREVPKALL